MNIVFLVDDILDIILDDCKIICHVCNKRFDFKKSFYKKQSKFYYCSKICYHSI